MDCGIEKTHPNASQQQIALGIIPPSSLPVFHDHFAEWSEEVGAVSLGRSSRLAYIFFGPIDRISVQLQSKTGHFPGGFW